MAIRRVDYDHIAPTYNVRYTTGAALRGTTAALRTLAAELNARRILEVGCGTAYWLAALSSTTDDLIGLDLSSGMLAKARERETHLALVQGRASQPPFIGEQTDLVYCVNAIHHFDDPRAFVFKAQRLLRPGGALAVLGTDPHTHQNARQWYVYDYFPGTRERDLARFPSWGMVHDWMVAAGFQQTRWQPVEQIHDPKIGRAVLDDPFLKKDACSQLALLSNTEYAAGLGRIKAALEEAEKTGTTLIFQTSFTKAMLVGWTSE